MIVPRARTSVLTLLLIAAAVGMWQAASPSRAEAPVATAAGEAVVEQRAAVRPSSPGVPDLSVPFRAGESFTYDVSWSRFVTAGTITLSVLDRRQSAGAAAWYAVAEVKPTSLVSRLYTLYYKAETLLDTRTLLPQRGTMFSQEGRRRRTKETRFDQAARRATFHMTTGSTMEAEQALNGPTHDALSAIFAMRAMPFSAGAVSTIEVADSGDMYRVLVRVTGRETVRVPAGRIAAWKVEPVVRDRQGATVGSGLALWFSDDARRALVRAQADAPVGSFVIALARP